jgi:phosphate transport system permease protein
MPTATGTLLPASPRRPAHRLLRLTDSLFGMVTGAAALVVPLLAVLLLYFLCRASALAWQKTGLSFFTSTAWVPSAEEFGAVPFIVGTLITSALAMILAVPISVAAATFLAEIAPGWLRRGASFLIELLAAIPSVIYGFWGIFFLVPVVKALLGDLGLLDSKNGLGRTIFTASVILAVMIVPYIAAITYDVCRAVPKSQREGALALGATRWQMIWRVVLPYARPGIIAGCFLALGRALGETMAVAMLVGNDPTLTWNIFHPGSTIPSIIANELGGADYELHRAALIELGLVLFVVTVVVNVLARVLLWRVGPGGGRPSLLGRVFVLRPVAAAAAPSPPADRAAAPTSLIRGVAARSRARLLWTDRLMTGLLGTCLMVTLIPLFHILGYLTLRGAGDVNWAFFTNRPIDQVPGLAPALYGTGVMVALATLAAVPLGILGALFLTEYRTSPLAPVVRFIADLLSGVPSVIVGILAYTVVVLPFNYSAYAGAFALSVLMLPIVLRSAEEALKLVPSSLRNASYALGASHAQTVVRILLPTALPTIITGICLAIARIAGETAPLLFTAGNLQRWPEGLSDRTPFLTYYIYWGAIGSDPVDQKLAWSAALVLLGLVMVLNVGIRLLTGKRALLASRVE